MWLQRRHSDALQRGRRQANDFALQLLIDLLRRGAGPRWRPTELHLEGPAPGHAEELAALAAQVGPALETVEHPLHLCEHIRVVGIRPPQAQDLVEAGHRPGVGQPAPLDPDQQIELAVRGVGAVLGP